MTSGRFHHLSPQAIHVERSERQRRTLNGIDELAESIARLGLIHPIVVTPDGVLIAGERRLTAIRQLGWTSIPVQYTSDLSDYELQSIELEENIKRINLSWQEEVEAIARFHKLKTVNEDGWRQEDTADALGLSRPSISEKLLVASQMTNEVVRNADRFSAASNIVQRNQERKKASALAGAKLVIGQPVEAPKPEVPILLANFHEWQESYDGPKFNLIHCDFPYGINVADAPRMAASIKDHYRDSPDIFWDLLARLSRAMDNVIAESAHLIFWHSMKFHCDTVQELTRMGWKCNPFPLIWHKTDGAGIAPDPQRGPRQTYEAAIFATRGDRKLTQAGCVANSFSHPGRREADDHVSEKPYPMLRHFMRMVCDEYSSVLDPTCGYGSAIKVATDLGASTCLGLEQSEQFQADAIANWSKRDAN
jgi:ParB/RepB/Spo0J family partition protein